MEKDKPIIIAQIMGKWIGGGVEAVVMNYYRHIDRTKIQFDFICDEDSTNIPYDEIEKLGTEVHYFPTFYEIENFLLENCNDNDLLITMGAGDVYKIGEKLLGK